MGLGHYMRGHPVLATLQFIARFVVIGLALAFVVVWLRPDWLAPVGSDAPSLSTDSYAAAVNRAAPSVVSIYTRTMVQEPLGLRFEDPLFQRLWRDRMVTRPRNGLGSGVIVDTSGLILTALHVIDGVDDIAVALWDGRVAEAQVIGFDRATDLALLQVNVGELPAASLAPAANVRVGDIALAIGNALGLNHTVTAGIISATGRGQVAPLGLADYIQTDAAINAGNSGGALINPRGEVIGINSATMGQSSGAQGISFAIPASVADAVMRDLLEHGVVIRGWLGVELTDTGVLFPASGTVRPGAGIAGLATNGPARQAGLRVGDVLIGLDGFSINSARELKMLIAEQAPGQNVQLAVVRGNTQFTVEVMLGQQPAS